MKTADYTRHIVTALEADKIAARLEDTILDFLAEPVVQCCILGLRALACSEPRQYWSEFREMIGDVRGLDPDDAPRWRTLESELGQARRHIAASAEKPPDDAEALREVLRTAVEPFLAPIRARYSQYARGTFYEDCLGKLAEVLAQEARRGAWQAALDGVEGIGTVPILTIHKSKGLEYEAVFFIGLEDGAFWNFGKAPDQEMNAFYVAVSRAKRKIVFTFSRVRRIGKQSSRQSAAAIGAIYKLMSKAGVHVQQHTVISDTDTTAT